MPKRKNDQEEPFFNRLAHKMVREEKDCWVAATELELGLTTDECAALLKNTQFQRLLRTERLKLYNELASDPERSKNTLVGQALMAIDKLMAAEQYDKALTGILNLAKIEGWVGADTNISVFAGLSSKEISELKNRLKTKNEDIEFPASGGTA